MWRVVLALIAFCALALPLPALAGGCNDPGATQMAAVVNVGAATTTQIVGAPAQAGLRVHLCQITASLAGTTPTFKLVYGTGTNCATGQGDLTGAFAPTSGSLVTMGYGDDMIVAPAGNAICGTTTGTGSSLQGFATFTIK